VNSSEEFIKSTKFAWKATKPTLITCYYRLRILANLFLRKIPVPLIQSESLYRSDFTGYLRKFWAVGRIGTSKSKSVKVVNKRGRKPIIPVVKQCPGVPLDFMKKKLLFAETQLFNKSSELMAVYNRTLERIFSVDCHRSLESSSKLCSESVKVKSVLTVLTSENATNYHPRKTKNHPDHQEDPLVEALAVCVKNKRFVPHTPFYEFLLSVVTSVSALQSTNSPSGIRYSPFAKEIFKALHGVGRTASSTFYWVLVGKMGPFMEYFLSLQLVQSLGGNQNRKSVLALILRFWELYLKNSLMFALMIRAYLWGWLLMKCTLKMVLFWIVMHKNSRVLCSTHQKACRLLMHQFSFVMQTIVILLKVNPGLMIHTRHVLGVLHSICIDKTI
jgi:hypothetical protein